MEDQQKNRNQPCLLDFQINPQYSWNFYSWYPLLKLQHKMLHLFWCSFQLRKINQGRWENWPPPQNKGEQRVSRHSVQGSISLRLLVMSSQRAVFTPPEQSWSNQIKLQPCSAQAPTSLSWGWGEKFYIINNQYLWLYEIDSWGHWWQSLVVWSPTRHFSGLRSITSTIRPSRQKWVAEESYVRDQYWANIQACKSSC